MIQQFLKELASEPTNHLKDDAHVNWILASPTELKKGNQELKCLSYPLPESLLVSMVFQMLILLEILAVTPHLLEPHQPDFEKVQ